MPIVTPTDSTARGEHQRSTSHDTKTPPRVPPRPPTLRRDPRRHLHGHHRGLPDSGQTYRTYCSLRTRIPIGGRSRRPTARQAAPTPSSEGPGVICDFFPSCPPATGETPNPAGTLALGDGQMPSPVRRNTDAAATSTPLTSRLHDPGHNVTFTWGDSNGRGRDDQHT